MTAMYNDVYNGTWPHGYPENRLVSPECYAGLNMTTERHPRDEYSLWPAIQAPPHEMNSPGPNATPGAMWDTGYFDYYKWKTSNHSSADPHNLSGLPWPRKDFIRDGRPLLNSHSHNHSHNHNHNHNPGGLTNQENINHVQDMHRSSNNSTGSYGKGSNGSLSNTSTPTHTPNTPLVVPQPVKPNRTNKTYQCKMCDQCDDILQIFTTKSDMLIHCQQIHKQDPKPYKCPTCSKCFANSSYLSQHARIHSGIKPYKCEICERKFTQLSHLQQHIRTHTGEKPYKCMHPGCGKAFSQLSNLQSHSRSHMTDKPFRCNSCYKCYADEQSLREHIPKHSDTKHLKTHICHICGKSYTQETYLTRHMVKHQTDGKKVISRPIKTEPMDPGERDYGRLADKPQDIPLGPQCNKGVSSAFMPLTQFAPNVSSSSNSPSYPYGPSLSANSLSSPLPHISSMASPRYFPYDPIGFRKTDPQERNLNVPMTSRDSMIANSLLSLQHIKNYASQQMPSFTPTCTTGSRLT